MWSDVERRLRPAWPGDILAAVCTLGVLSAGYSTLLIATLGARLGRDPWLDWFQLGTILFGDTGIVMQPHWHHFAAGLIVHNAVVTASGVVLVALLARWSWTLAPSRLLVAGLAWALVTAAAWYYVVFPGVGQTVRMQMPFWTWAGGHAAAAVAYPAFPWIRHAITGWQGPHVPSSRRAAAALALAGVLAVGWSIAGDGPGPIRAGGSDRAFLYEMTNHHEAGIGLARLAADRSADQEVRALAHLMIYQQFREDIVMRRWWRAWFDEELPTMSEEERRRLPGMPAPADFAALDQLIGVALDRRFLELAIAHHEGSVILADRASRSAGDPRTWILADAIRYPMRNQVTRMRGLLRSAAADLTEGTGGRIGNP